MPNTLRIPFDELRQEFLRILLKYNFSQNKAETCATIFAESSRDGVYSHGVNRFPAFVHYVKHKRIDVHAEPTRSKEIGAIEQWNGNLGPGPLNALACTERAMELARKNGLGAVALSNTNHWMRGGTYGWHAAKRGFMFIGWTNTIANTAAWGSAKSRLGNNPLVIALPYKHEAVVLDMAISQFSYGKLEAYKMRNEPLPVAGGHDRNGQLTQDPGAILATQRLLPIGFWKGSGLSLLLDMLATVLTGGLATHEITKKEWESALSQVYIACDISRLNHTEWVDEVLSAIIDDLHTTDPERDFQRALYPGERVLKTRIENMKNGIPVNDEVWAGIKAL